MDGSEDDLLFRTESDDDEDPFEGFSATDADTAQRYMDNIQLDGNDYSSNSEPESEDAETDSDPGSPGR